MEAAMRSPDALGLYGKLTDRFGDNGLISIVLGHRAGAALEIDLWLMSCRVLKRDMEVAMLDALAERAQAMGLQHLHARYLPTKKNALVALHYDKLGFKQVEEDSEGNKTYALDLTQYQPGNRHIRVAVPVEEQVPVA